MSCYQYRLYGLTLRTNRPLPELESISGDDGADIVAELAGTDAMASVPASGASWIPIDPPRPMWKAHTPDGTFWRMRYAGAGHELEFILDGAGRRVWATWNELVSIDDVSALLLGPILSCVLRRRALTCLHASVVGVDGRALAFLGNKGAGKSTTALALLQRGASFVSDDVAVLDASAGGFGVRAGPAMLRMREEPAAALCGSFGELRPMWSRDDERPRKRYLDLGDGGSAANDGVIPLGGIYLLAERDDVAGAPSISPIGAAEAIPLLMANLHMSFMVEADGHARDFATIARLASCVPVRRVRRAEGLDTIAQVADIVLADAGNSR